MFGRRRWRMPWSSGTSSGTWSPDAVRLTSDQKATNPAGDVRSNSPDDATPTVAFPITTPVDPAGLNGPNKADQANSPEDSAAAPRAAASPAAARPSLLDWEAWRARTGGAGGRSTQKKRPDAEGPPAVGPARVLTPSAPTGRRPQPRAGGADGQALRCWPSPPSARCSAGSPRSRPRSAGRPEPGARGVHRPRERDRHARPRWDRHRPERRRYRSKRRQAGQPGPVVDTAGRTDRPADRRAGVGRSRRPVLGRGDRLPGSPRGHRARRDLRLPDRADLGPRQRAPAADRQPGQGRHPADAARPAAARPDGGRPGARPFHDRKQRSTPPRPSCGTRSGGRQACAPTTRPSACSRPRPRRAWSARASAGRAGA